jgi:hypothetical protein
VDKPKVFFVLFLTAISRTATMTTTATTEEEKGIYGAGGPATATCRAAMPANDMRHGFWLWQLRATTT